jgi:hypothetical protein
MAPGRVATPTTLPSKGLIRRIALDRVERHPYPSWVSPGAGASRVGWSYGPGGVKRFGPRGLGSGEAA